MKKIINRVEVTYGSEQDYLIVEDSYKKILHLFGNERRKQIETAFSQNRTKTIRLRP